MALVKWNVNKVFFIKKKKTASTKLQIPAFLKPTSQGAGQEPGSLAGLPNHAGKRTSRGPILGKLASAPRRVPPPRVALTGR